MVTLARRAHRIPFAPVVALLFGVVSAILVAAVPQWMFEAGVVASGLPTVLAAASPPLGLVARLLAIALAFGMGSIAVWSLVAPLTKFLEAKARARTPWRDAGYDAEMAFMTSDPLPPRRPIFAPDELGAPLMSDEAILPVSPMHEPAEASATPLEAEEPARVAFAPVTASETIPDLIRRLENGLARRAARGGDPDDDGHNQLPPSDDRDASNNVANHRATGPTDDAVRQALSPLRKTANR